MNRKIDWDNYEKNSQKNRAKKNLEKTQSGSISFIRGIDKLTRWEDFNSHWEDYLSSSDYWKNWQVKINSFQTEKEVNFYVDRLQKFIDFVEKYTRKDISHYCGRVIEGSQQWDPKKTPKLIEQELKRLENISEEEFRKSDKWSGVEWKEMDVKEISDFLEWDDKEREKSSKDNVLGSGSINQSPAKKKNLQSGGSWKKGLVWGSVGVVGLLVLILASIR